MNPSPVFQSHAGSIEAHGVSVDKRRDSRRFNPTLVRLRPRCMTHGASIPLSFNPTLVRLRHESQNVLLSIPSAFQSHAGSIEAAGVAEPDVGRALFQSHAGSIEAGLWRFASLSRSSFQSHAGSIEACVMWVSFSIYLAFQSHAGSIEAGHGFDLLCDVGLVSIPRWFD